MSPLYASSADIQVIQQGFHRKLRYFQTAVFLYLLDDSGQLLNHFLAVTADKSSGTALQQAVFHADPPVKFIADHTDSISRTPLQLQMIQIQNAFHLLDIRRQRVARDIEKLT